MTKELIILLVFAAINIASGKYQAWLFDVKQKRINHKDWAAVYTVLCLASVFITHNWLTILSCGTMRMPLFNIVLNLSRKPKRSIFYVDIDDPNGSETDKVLYKYYKPIFLLDALLFIIIQLFIYV